MPVANTTGPRLATGPHRLCTRAGCLVLFKPELRPGLQRARSIEPNSPIQHAQQVARVGAILLVRRGQARFWQCQRGSTGPSGSSQAKGPKIMSKSLSGSCRCVLFRAARLCPWPLCRYRVSSVTPADTAAMRHPYRTEMPEKPEMSAPQRPAILRSASAYVIHAARPAPTGFCWASKAGT